MESRVVPAQGIDFEPLEVSFLKGTSGLRRLRSLARLPAAGLRALALMRRVRPDAVIGLGGFVSGPPCLAAALTGRRMFLLEQNAVPGATNRLLGRLARRVFSTFEAANRHFAAGRAVTMGNPIRGAVLGVSASRAPRAPGSPVRLLVVGGSQGARSLNERAAGVVRALIDRGIPVRVTHGAGAGNGDKAAAAYAQAGVEADVRDYIDPMAAAYADADLVIARAGATTISELTVVGLPALYVPFPLAADDHQTRNAEAVTQAGGGLVVRDADFNGENAALLEALTRVMSSEEELSQMSGRAASLGRPDAARQIAEAILAEIEQR
jgi:UDP-N-acetylglucosamine--N-acetylmuramyl-(pentapeptide) pyrophosphoryl-undecaprenol N-acetylglucosamine transferase